MSSTILLRFRNFLIWFSRPQPRGIWLGWSLAVASTIAFSLVTPLGKVAIGLGFYPTTLLMLRFGLAAILMVGSIALTAPAKLRIDRRGLFIAGSAGIINGLGSLAFFWSLTRIDAAVATMIFSLNPLVVLGALALRGEKLTHRHLVRLILALGGAYLLLGPGGQTDWLGTALVLAGVCGFTIELVFIQWFLQSYDTRTITLYVLAGMGAVITGSWFAQGMVWHAATWQGWLALGLMAVVGTYFGWWAMFTGIQRIGSGQVALLMPVETMLSVSWAALFLGERLTGQQLLGSSLILVSALLAIQRLKRVRWKPRWRAWQRS